MMDWFKKEGYRVDRFCNMVGKEKQIRKCNFKGLGSIVFIDENCMK